LFIMIMVRVLATRLFAIDKWAAALILMKLDYANFRTTD